jgi:hypothetical protein
VSAFSAPAIDDDDITERRPNAICTALQGESAQAGIRLVAEPLLASGDAGFPGHLVEFRDERRESALRRVEV